MATAMSLFMVVACLLVSSSVALLPPPSPPAGLRVNFYKPTCPNAETIVFQEMKKIFNTIDPLQPEIGKNVAPDLLRLHFHDCFVDGCDASVLLDGPNSEKTAPPNVRLEGFQNVDTIKAALEAACPGVVSCADLLAFAARDAVRLTGGIRYSVAAGRRDGFISVAAHAVANLPNPQMNVNALTANFNRQGLTQADLVALSGAHTIGDVACHHIDNRLYTFPGVGSDPSLPPAFLSRLKRICPRPGLFDVIVDTDQFTPITFDVQYYKNLIVRESVLSSDQVLFTDLRTRPLVNRFAADPAAFLGAFNRAIGKMGRIQTLTGTAGEIRRNCREVNTV